MTNLMLFAGQQFYPTGGIDDLIGCYNSIEEIRRTITFLLYGSNSYWLKIEPKQRWLDWYHIYDIDRKVIVESFNCVCSDMVPEQKLDEGVWQEQEKYIKLGYKFEIEK